MSFSTRSSLDLNGSLHSTVRWAWSLSLRCTQSTVKSRRPLLGLLDEFAAEPGPGGLGRVVDRLIDLGVGAMRSTSPPLLHAVEQAALARHVVVLQVHEGDLGVGQRQAVALAVALV